MNRWLLLLVSGMLTIYFWTMHPLLTFLSVAVLWMLNEHIIMWADGVYAHRKCTCETTGGCKWGCHERNTRYDLSCPKHGRVAPTARVVRGDVNTGTHAEFFVAIGCKDICHECAWHKDTCQCVFGPTACNCPVDPSCPMDPPCTECVAKSDYFKLKLDRARAWHVAGA